MNTMNSTGGMNTSQMLSTLGKEAPNFFGLTSLGSNCLAEAKPRTLPFHYYEPDAFVESFRTFRNEELEQALLVSGEDQLFGTCLTCISSAEPARTRRERSSPRRLTRHAMQECGKSQPGHEFILRSELSQAIRRVRDGAELSPQEWQAYHTYFDADTAGGELHSHQFPSPVPLPKGRAETHSISTDAKVLLLP